MIDKAKESGINNNWRNTQTYLAKSVQNETIRYQKSVQYYGKLFMYQVNYEMKIYYYLLVELDQVNLLSFIFFFFKGTIFICDPDFQHILYEIMVVMCQMI